MNKNNVRVRFAPSPTGSLHVGNARTALFNWLFARHHHGVLVLRIEDTDQERTLPQHTKSLLADLNWLEIDWDEGPVVGGGYGPYNQIERKEIYTKHLQGLIDKGLVYPCYCTETELEEERALLIATHQTPRYLGKCRNLNAAQRQELENQGRKPAWRFRVGSGEIVFEDLIRGRIQFLAESIGDFIIVRSNGIPAYNFAVVVDDALMEISHVIRGEDHLSNTALQLLLYQELGLKPPRFAHHSLVLGKDRAKLSKRHGAVAIGEFRRLGFLPKALINYLALCGTFVAERKEICSREEMISSFSLANMGKSGAVFDEDKLRWLNAQYIRDTADADLASLLTPLAEEVFLENTPDEKWLEAFCACFKDNFVTLQDAGEYLRIFNDTAFKLDNAARSAVGAAEAQQILGALRFILETGLATAGGALSYQVVVDSLKKATGLKGRALFLPVRAALTGAVEGIELDKLFALMTTPSMLTRLKKAMSWG
ncbi:MAG: glutamate--tRNA ligase [Deltaproteobacteria bacterium]|nr:glutamate--tRNA ligase [Deltaproteobacteria bacterium]